jgi:hypothetical protein
LTLAAVNDAPVMGNNSGSVIRGQTLTIGSSVLHAADPDDTPAELVYTVTSLPSAGSLRLSGVALEVNGTFTQDDVNNARVAYAHGGDAGTSDAVTFAVSDGAGGSLASVGLSITVNPPPPPTPVVVAPPPSPQLPTALPPPLSPPSSGGAEPLPQDGGAQPAGVSSPEDGGIAASTPGATGAGSGEGMGGGGGGAPAGVAAALADALLGPDPAGLTTGGTTAAHAQSQTAALAPGPAVRALSSNGALNPGPQVAWVNPNAAQPAPAAESAAPAIGLSAPVPLQISEALVGFQRTLGNNQWVGELNRMRETVDTQIQAESPMVISTVAVTGGLSVGYVLWLLRGGLLISSLLSSLPAWSVVDPLPVLARGRQDDEAAGAEDDPLEKLFGRARAALGLARDEPPPQPPEAAAMTPATSLPQLETDTRSA